MSEMKSVYRAANLPQAHLLKQALESAGIHTAITHDVSEVSSNWNAGPIVLVSAQDVEAAKPVVAEFERHIIEDAARVGQASEDSPKDEYWKEWPRCPECQALRQAICPICKAAGAHFPLADFIPAAQVHSIGAGKSAEPTYDDTNVLLMCDACEEAFAPRFYRRCYDCGHDFEDGVRIASEPPAEFSGRVVAVLFGTLALLGGLMAFFAWVLR